MAEVRPDLGPGARSEGVEDVAEGDSGAVGQILGDASSTYHATLPATFELLLSTNPVPMWVYDLQTLRFIAVNEAALARYGYSREQFLQLRIVDIRPLEDIPLLRDELGSARGPVERSGPWRHVTADGRELTCQITSHTVTWEGRPAAIVASEELHAEPESGVAVAARDETPAPWGEVAFDNLLAGVLAAPVRSSRRVAALVFELLRLEVVEAAAGMAGAYVVVNEVVARLAGSSEPQDQLVRIDSRRFGLVVERDDPEGVVAAGRAVLQSLRRPIDVPGVGQYRPLVVGAVRLAEAGERDSGRMISDVLVALRVAADGEPTGGVVVFDEPMRGTVAGRLELELALRQAIPADELFLHYQPIVNLSALGIEGYEALLRWDRTGKGLANPATVVEVAEESGMIGDLGNWVRRRALTEAGRAVQSIDGSSLLAVNLSPHELADDGLAASIAGICEEAGVDPSRVCLELTESSFVSAEEDGGRYQRLLALKSSGVKIAVDDFGTGYSALSYLKYLPVDIVKIDRSFVAGLEVSPADAVLVETITRMAHALDLTVIAEGVETATQVRLLRELGVEQGQGFLFARPAIWADAARATIRLE